MVSNEVYGYALVVRLICIAMMMYVVYRQGEQIRLKRTRLRLILFFIWCAILTGNLVPFFFDLDHIINDSDSLLVSYILSNPTTMLIAVSGIFVMYRFTDRFKE